MVNCVNNYGSSVYLNKVNLGISETKNQQASSGVSKPKEKLDEFISKDKEFLSTCTDGQDDGKISFKEGAKAFLGGIANHYFDFVDDITDFVKENPLKSAALTAGALAIGGIALATFGAPLVLGMLSTAGIVFGVKSVINGAKGAVNNIKDAKNATTDAEKKAALYGLGGNSAEFVDGALAIYGGAKGVKEAATLLSQADDCARVIPDIASGDDIYDGVKDLLKKAEDGSLSKEEFDVLKEFIDKKDDIFSNDKLSIKNILLNGIFGSFASQMHNKI